jgi:hypothetical protein
MDKWNYLGRASRRGVASRSAGRGFRPRAEGLESRELLSLAPGNLLTEPIKTFTANDKATSTAMLKAFETEIGGANNSTTAGPVAAGGFRTIDWDGVKLDGTDFAGTTVINAGKTVAIPRNRFQARGVFFEQVYAVSGDGFNDVNPNVTGLFNAFSPNNTFAMFNDNTIDLAFTVPSAATGDPVPAATRGFGAIFLNSQVDSTSSIEYFSGDRSLGKVDVPSGAKGDVEFAGALFPDAVVTRVTLILGNETLFTFNGTTVTGTTTNNPPMDNLVVTDDFAYAEPKALDSAPPVLPGPQGTLNALTAVNAVVGVPFSGRVATFSDTDNTSTAQNFTATINWGDGHITNGTITKNAQNGFDVAGTNTFGRSGRIPISVDVQKFDAAGTSLSFTNTAEVTASDTTTTLTVAPNSTIVGQSVTLTAKVATTPSGPIPSGVVVFNDGATIVGVATLDNTGTATLTTSSLTRGTHNLTASLLVNPDFKASTSLAVAATVRTDVTSQIQITRSAIKRRGRQFFQQVTLVNNGDTIPGPLDFVLDNLSTRVIVRNASGKTAVLAPVGSPFVTFVGPGANYAKLQSASIMLIFRAPNARLVRYTPRILAGLTQP